MRVGRLPSFWLLVLLAAIGIAIGCKPNRQPSTSANMETDDKLKAEPGFRDFVKNPEFWDDVEKAHNDVEHEIAAAKEWSDEKVATAVRRFIFEIKSSSDDWSQVRLLKSLGSKTHPTILLILKDPSVRGKLVEPTGENLLPEAPFNRLCDVLGDDPPPSAVDLLSPFLDENSKEIRKSCAMTIASVGNLSIIAPVRKALGDSDEYVRSYALMGIERAIESMRLEPDCSRELFDDIRKLLAEGKNCRDAAQLLLGFDQKQAVEFFLSDKTFTPDSKCLHDALRAMNDRAIKVPRERLLDLIEKLKDQELKYPQTYLFGELLHSLGRHKVLSDHALMTGYLSHTEEIIASGAAEGILASHGVDGFRKRIWDTIARRGREALTDAQRRVNAVDMYDGEVNNGGLSQYFFNSSGDEWKTALAGLEAMGSKERLAILREAVAKFGPAGPAEDRRQRMMQLSKLENVNSNCFGELDSRFYKCKENADVLATRYVLKNPEAFR